MTEGAKAKHSVKETVTSVVIAFTLAFVFRGFVMEAFVIPTGSMAPTLRGAHTQMRSPVNGYEWATGPQESRTDDPSIPRPVQGRVMSEDPHSGRTFPRTNVPIRWGDRIFVMKYLASVYDPDRFDVVVFKNPNDPTMNYIKRLIGLPGEQVALIDGDVFVRTPRADDPMNADGSPADPWRLEGWSVARKPELAQLAMWQDVFDSTYSPGARLMEGFVAPWAGLDDQGGEEGWETRTPQATAGDGRAPGEYRYGGQGPTTLRWTGAGGRTLEDRYPYNLNERMRPTTFPVSDVRMSMGIRPKDALTRVSAVVATRGHEFRADIEGKAVKLMMRRTVALTEMPTEALPAPWKGIGAATLERPLPVGKVTNLDFWHVDQGVELRVDGLLVARGAYEWSPAERLRYAMGLTIDDIEKNPEPLRNGSLATRPECRWEFEGGAFTLYRVAMQRDIHYRAELRALSTPSDHTRRTLTTALATAPQSQLTLTPDEFFLCGDNSPASLDGRMWDYPHPWIAPIDPRPGVVHRDLIIGRAFFVYFPAPHRVLGLPIPDVGRMRWIW
jgi:signal peptidase I